MSKINKNVSNCSIKILIIISLICDKRHKRERESVCEKKRKKKIKIPRKTKIHHEWVWQQGRIERVYSSADVVGVIQSVLEIPRAACAPKLMQERREVTFELWWLDKLVGKKKNQIEWMPSEWEQSSKRKITRSSCADQYPKDQLKSIGLAQIRLGRLSDTRETGQLPEQISTSKQVLLLTPNESVTMIRRGRNHSFSLLLLLLSIWWFLRKQVLQY